MDFKERPQLEAADLLERYGVSAGRVATNNSQNAVDKGLGDEALYWDQVRRFIERAFTGFSDECDQAIAPRITI